MDQIPVELLDLIASFSNYDDLPQLSTISRTWQSVIERRTMRAIDLQSTELEDFSNIFVHHSRQAALVNLSYNVILPAYSDYQCARFETDDDQQQNNEVLTDAVHALFSLLHSWDEEAARLAETEISSRSRPRRMLWTLNAYSPADVDHREGADVEMQRFYAEQYRGRQDIFEHRYERSFLRIFNYEGLPAVSRISRFHVKQLCDQRRIEGATLVRIAAKLPNLETIVWAVNDNEKHNPLVRQNHRFEFAQCLATLSIQSLKRVDLTLFNRESSNQNMNVPSALLPSAPSTDHLSLALHTLSKSPNLTHLSLKGNVVLSPCFFGPENHDDPSTVAPFWPSLEELDVCLNITTLSGHWLYKRDPSNPESDPEPTLYGNNVHTINLEEDLSTHSSDSESPESLDEPLQSEIPDTLQVDMDEATERALATPRFRTVLDGDRVRPMLIAMARAAATRHMPAMRRLALHLNPDSLSGLDIICLVDDATPSESQQEGYEAGKTAKFSSPKPCRLKHWDVSIGSEAKWTPPEDLKAAWEDSARGGLRAKDGAGGSTEDKLGDSSVKIEYYSDRDLVFLG